MMTNMEVARWAFVYLVTLNIVAYVGFLCWGWWSKRRALAKIWRQYKMTGYKATGITTHTTPSFHAGGSVSNPIPYVIGLSRAGATMQAFESLGKKPELLEETWSPEKIEAWRVISVTVEKGDDGMWLGFPHPDGPTEDVVTPVRHPVGVELHAECTLPERGLPWNQCDETPGESCDSDVGDGCGFYAFKTRGAAVTHLVALANGPFLPEGLSAVAKVLLSGKVIEHENGYRAEILEVVSIEPVSYRDSCDSFLSVIGATTRAFNAFTQSYIVSGGV